jgi:mono/diheme cytochrome c family protein
MRTTNIICIAAALLAFVAAPAGAADKIERGAYLAAIMDCTGCHTPGALRGQPDMDRYLAGADVGFMIPGAGTFYAPNLTGDAETGLGKWSVDEIVAAIRSGVRPDGSTLVPVMPFPSYATLNDADAEALATYIKSLAPITNKVPGPFGPDQTPGAPYLQPVVPK